MTFPRCVRALRNLFLLAVLGMLAAALSGTSAAAAPTPAPKPMKSADTGAFLLRWGNDRRTSADRLRAAVNPGGKRVTVGSMLDAATLQAHTQNKSTCRDKAEAKNSVLSKAAGVVAYYCLDDEDTDTKDWTPQGLSGTEDAQPGAGTVDGHHAMVISWHQYGVGSKKTAKQTQVSFLDTDPTKNKYIHVLLVQPNGDGTDYSDVSTHAGGVVWYKHYLFVAGPTSGLRVFDTDDLLQLAHNPKGSTDPDCPTGLHDGKYCAGGYQYLLPEIGQWVNEKPDTRYDSVSLERGPGDPVFLTSEYRENSVGRVARWTSDEMTRFSGGIQPYRAWHQPVPYVQGAFSRGCYYFDAGGAGSTPRLVSAEAATDGTGATASQAGALGLQDLYWLRSAGDGGQLWTLTEHAGAERRFIYGVARPKCP